MFKDKIVLVGSSAAGLSQTYQTPGTPVYAYLDVHAQLLATVLSGNVIKRSQEFLLWESLAGILTAGLLCTAIARMDLLGSSLIGAMCIIIFWIGAETIFQSKGLLFSPLLPTCLVLGNYTALTILKIRKSRNLARKLADDSLHLLKSSENRLNSIIRTIPDIVFRVDPAGHITFISHAISKYVDCAQDLIGRSIFDFVAPDDREKAEHRLNERRTGERATLAMELRMYLPGKQNIETADAGYFSLSAQGIYEDGLSGKREFIGAQGILRDITEKKKTENQLARAQKMEAIGLLAGGVAHDLNNMLGAIVGYPELLLDDLPLDSPLRPAIKAIKESGERAAAIVQDLLTLTRRGVMINEILNLNAIVRKYFESSEFEKLREFHPGVMIKQNLDAALLNIVGSPVHLMKFIANLMNNAAEAMPEGGEIAVTTENRHLDKPVKGYDSIAEGDYVSVAISDNGIGMSAADLQRIFEPFYTKKVMGRSGTGLGMSVVWGTVKDHGGYIDIASQQGEGTTITIYFPATRKEFKEQETAFSIESCKGSGQTILVVDDVQAQRDVARAILTRLGYRVETAASGEEAVQYLKTNTADLLVLDMIMAPGIDGLETYKRILEMHPKQKAVIASGYSETDQVRQAQALGAGAYVKKPYTIEKLGKAIKIELNCTDDQ